MTGPRVELQSDDKVMTEVKANTENKGIVISGCQKDSAPKETRAVSNMSSLREANVIDGALLP